MKVNINVRALEELLKKAGKKGEFAPELSDDAIESLIKHAKPIQPSKDLLPELERIILDAVKERQSSEAAELRESVTFGEYFKKLRDRIITLGSVSISDFIPASITAEKMRYIELDEIKRLSAADIAKIIIQFGIPFERALELLKSSFKIEDLKEKRLFAGTNARVSEELNSEARYRTTKSSMQKLLLALDAKKTLSDIDQVWQAFKFELEKELKAANYI
jgi:hypothetical protein